MVCTNIDGYAEYNAPALWAADPTFLVPRCAKCDALCRTCDGAIPNLCRSCHPGFYLLTETNTCIPACFTHVGYYIWDDAGIAKCSPCDVRCENCIETSTKCTSCSPGVEFLNTTNTCKFCQATNMLEIPVSLTVKRPYCLICAPYCSSCITSPNICTGCFYGYRLNSVTSLCEVCSNDTFADNSVVPPVCSPCSSTCTTCFGTSTYCTSCLAPLMISTENSCVPGSPFNLTGAPYTDSVLPPPKPDIAVQFALDARADYLEQFTPEVLAQLAGTFQITVTFYANSTKLAETLTTRRSVGYLGQKLYSFFLYVDGIPGDNAYQVNFTVAQRQNLTVNGSYFVLEPFNYSTEYKFPSDINALKGASEQGQLTANLMGTLPIKNQAAVDVTTALISADPSGVSTRFSQVLKASSKMLYINVNYGRKLMAFLESTEVFANTLKDDQRTQVKQSTAYRARLSQKKILLKLASSSLGWKLWMYLASSVISLVTSAALAGRWNTSKWCLYVMYYQPKLHLIIYNIVFVDFYFYAPRTALHCTDLFERIVAIVCFQFLMLDLCRYLLLIWNDQVWRVIYRRYKEVEDELEKAVAALKVEKSTNPNNDSTFVKDLDPDKQSPENSILDPALPISQQEKPAESVTRDQTTSIINPTTSPDPVKTMLPSEKSL